MTDRLTEVRPAHVMVKGGAIRARRQDLGLTVIGLARRVPMSFGYLSSLERGTRPTMSPPMFKLLVAALDMTDRADELKVA